MLKVVRENWSSMLTILFLIVVGILLLVNPGFFAVTIIRIAGVLICALGIYDLVKYFRADPVVAAKGSGFYSGSLMIAGGVFCVLQGEWFVSVFPILAVLYGMLQILLGFRKLQRTVDALRLNLGFWWLRGISAAISLVFGLIIVMNPEMTMMGVWVFTGITMIVEGVFDAVALGLQIRNQKAAISA
ncbi:MAG: DUF308 domain-containing protein [Clostridia bacterium]|nr:DUF308 domain-containing protein [Clostridia bacterium]